MPRTRPTTPILALVALLAFARPGGAQAPEVELDPRLPFATARLIEIRLEADDTTVVAGDTTIDSRTTHEGSLVHLGGSLVLEGTVSGDITAVASRVWLRPGAVVGGDITVIGGTLYGSTMATLQGRRTWLRGEPVTVEQIAPGRILVAHVPPETGFPLEPKGLWGIVVHEYNGVDGLSFGLAAGLKKLPDQPRTELAFGPVFRSERDDVGWDVVGLRDLPRAGLTIGGRFHRITDTHQRWQRRDLANSLLSVGLADDDRTYFERTGYELWVERSLLRPLPLTIRLRWRDDEYDSLESAEPFALFDDDAWPANPPVDEGRGRALGVRITYDRRDVPEFPTRGLFVQGEVDHWGFGGDPAFEFEWGRVEARGWLPVAGRSFVVLRGIAGGRLDEGTVPTQFLWRLGGAGSIAGYDALLAPLTGDRMALANLRAHLALPVATRMFETVYLVGLADVGDAWRDGESPDWHPGIGAGLAGHGQFRYLGVFAAYGVEEESWKAIFVATPWYD